MSVLIKGMSGYECCADCEFCGGLIIPDDIYVCDCPPTRGMDITRAIEEDCKHPDCQLAELPEKHGRLIDADALITKRGGLAVDSENIVELSPGWTIPLESVIDIEPTVVEAEGK